MRLAAIACILLLPLAGCYESSEQQAADSTNATTTNQAAPATSTPEAPESDEAAFLADALKQVEDGTALLVDVRSDEEWNESHFAVANHIPVDKIKEDPESAFSEIKKNKQYSSTDDQVDAPVRLRNC